MKSVISKPSGETTLERALQRLVAEVAEGLRHGFFEFSVGCEIVSQERRQLTLRAGKSHRFVIPKEDCIASPPSTVIPATGTPAQESDTPRCIAGTASARQAQTGAGLGLLVAHVEQR